MAGLNIPKRSELPRGTFLGDVNNARLDAQAKLSDYAERASGVAGDMLFGEDTGEGMLKDLAYGLVPGGSLFQRATTGTRPGLLDFADFVPGGGVAKAMLPIAAKPTLDALKAGQRMGKTGRNLKKAQNPYIERWHRTRSKNDASIQKKGLLIGKDNPNYAKNTGDADEFQIPVNWLANNPTEIPVLQYYFKNLPDEVSTYRVRIPKDVYYSTPRMKFGSGMRSTASDASIVANGEPSLSGEIGRRTGKQSKIDLYGSSIPPENLEKIPNNDILAKLVHDEQMETFAREHLTGNESPSEIGNYIVKNEMNDWIPASERFYDNSVATTPIPHDDNPPYIQLYERAAGVKHGVPKYGARVLAGDMPYKFDTPWEFYEKQYYPEDIDKYAMGSISRGWVADRAPWERQEEAVDRRIREAERWSPKHRRFDWDLYNEYIESGASPRYATHEAAPQYELNDDPIQGLLLKVTRDPKPSTGHISRPIEEIVDDDPEYEFQRQPWWNNETFRKYLNKEGWSPYSAAVESMQQPYGMLLDTEADKFYVQPLPGEWYHTPAVGSISRASDDFNNTPRDPYEAYWKRLELEKLVGASEREAKENAAKAFRATIRNNIR